MPFLCYDINQAEWLARQLYRIMTEENQTIFFDCKLFIRKTIKKINTAPCLTLFGHFEEIVTLTKLGAKSPTSTATFLIHLNILKALYLHHCLSKQLEIVNYILANMYFFLLLHLTL